MLDKQKSSFSAFLVEKNCWNFVKSLLNCVGTLLVPFLRIRRKLFLGQLLNLQHCLMSEKTHSANTSEEHTQHSALQRQEQRHERDVAAALHKGERFDLWSLRWSSRLGRFRGSSFRRSCQTLFHFGGRALKVSKRLIDWRRGNKQRGTTGLPWLVRSVN